MVYYHVRISVEGVRHDEVKTDMNDETLDHQILEPYQSGRPITINGKTIPLDAVERIRISTSEVGSAQLIEHIKAADKQSSVVNLDGPSYAWRAAARATDVTDQFITGPHGPAIDPVSPTSVTTSRGGLKPETIGELDGLAAAASSVFVVAGRDSKAVAAVVALLRALGLRIVEWEHAVARTGLPSPYVGDVVEAGLRMASAAVVILTPDDLVRLRDDLISDKDGPQEREFRGQARPNVYYEAGIADALGRDRTVIVEIGEVKSFSDAAGRHVVRYDGSAGKKNALAERLRVAGLVVDTSAEDWLTAGDVGPALAAATTALDSAATNTSATADKTEILQAIGQLLAILDQLRERSRHDDLSDLPDESLEFVIRSQALIDRYAASTSYASEVERARKQPPHLRIPVLAAAMRALLSDLAD